MGNNKKQEETNTKQEHATRNQHETNNKTQMNKQKPTRNTETRISTKKQ